MGQVGTIEVTLRKVLPDDISQVKQREVRDSAGSPCRSGSGVGDQPDCKRGAMQLRVDGSVLGGFKSVESLAARWPICSLSR